MAIHDGRASIAPGAGLVARATSTMMVVRASSPAQEQALDELLLLTTGPHAMVGPALVRRVAALVVQLPAADVPDVGLVTASGAGDVLVLLAGDVRLAAAGADENLLAAHGREATTYVDRVLPGDLRSLTVSLDGGAEPDPRSVLGHGVVRGDGFRLDEPQEQAGSDALRAASPTGTVTAIPRPAPPASHAVPPSEATPTFTTFSLLDVEPLPESPVVTGDAGPARTEPAGTTPVEVRGVACSRGHFNPLDADSCRRCGTPVLARPGQEFVAPRPSLGVLVAEDGTTYDLVGDYVVGREPEVADAVRSGAARPIILDDPQLALSRVHAHVFLDGWEVRISDAGSGNGTFVAPAGSDWHRLEPERPETITVGTRIAVGPCVLTVESPA
jgi:hypothetical protein